MTRNTFPGATAELSVHRLASYEISARTVPTVRAGSVKHHRCAWAVTTGEPAYLRYHDTEWGVPTFDDRKLFELLTLACAQTGLSWFTVLVRRDAYRRAFADFDPVQVAEFDVARQVELLETGIVRNRLKMAAAVSNAGHFLELQSVYGSFAKYLWGFVDGTPIQNRFRFASEVPARTSLAERISRDLKRRGFRYVGAKTVYAYLQATGVVNDHLVGCFRHASVAQLAHSTHLS